MASPTPTPSSLPPSPAPRRGFGRVVSRALAVLFALAAAAMVVVEFTRWLHVGALQLTPIGRLWFEIHSGSLLLLQPAIERHLHPALWTWIVQPVLEAPALPVFLGLALFFAWLGWRRRAR